MHAHGCCLLVCHGQDFSLETLCFLLSHPAVRPWMEGRTNAGHNQPRTSKNQALLRRPGTMSGWASMLWGQPSVGRHEVVKLRPWGMSLFEGSESSIRQIVFPWRLQHTNNDKFLLQHLLKIYSGCYLCYRYHFTNLLFFWAIYMLAVSARKGRLSTCCRMRQGFGQLSTLPVTKHATGATSRIFRVGFSNN